MLELTLPFPPSVNHYWRRVGFRTLISREGRAYRERVCALLAADAIRPLDGRLAMHIEAYPPDRRRHDCDNLLKAPLDALAQGGAYQDDSQIDWLSIEKLDPVPNGELRIWILEEGVEDVHETETARSRLLRWLWTRYNAAARKQSAGLLPALPGARADTPVSREYRPASLGRAGVVRRVPAPRSRSVREL